MADSIRKFDSKLNRTADSIQDSIRTQKNDSQVPIFKLSVFLVFKTCVLWSNEQDLQDELEDLTEMSNEVQEVMGRSYGMPEVDDDELEAELDALGDEIALDDDTSYLDEAVRAPNAPTTVPGADSVRTRVCTILDMFELSAISTNGSSARV